MFPDKGFFTKDSRQKKIFFQIFLVKKNYIFSIFFSKKQLHFSIILVKTSPASKDCKVHIN